MKRITILIIAISALLYTGCGSKGPMSVTFEPLNMKYGDPGRTEAPYAKDPTVIHLGDRYLMYYSARDYAADRIPEGFAFTGWSAAIAESRDIVNWTRVGDLYITDTKGEQIWGVVAPCVKIFDGVVHMFYQKFWAGAADGGNNNIWHATSADGIHFTNTCDEPILIPHTDWSIERSIDAEVYKVNDKMILLFATRDLPKENQLVAMAEAPYGSDYGPDKWTLLSTDGPLLKPDYEWEGHCIEAPTVIERDGYWYMFYAGAYNHEHQQIGLAISSDGYNYERVQLEGEEPGLVFKSGAPGTWNAGESGHPGVFEDNDGSVYLFFQGKESLKADYFLSVAKVTFQKGK